MSSINTVMPAEIEIDETTQSSMSSMNSRGTFPGRSLNDAQLLFSDEEEEDMDVEVPSAPVRQFPFSRQGTSAPQPEYEDAMPSLVRDSDLDSDQESGDDTMPSLHPPADGTYDSEEDMPELLPPDDSFVSFDDSETDMPRLLPQDEDSQDAAYSELTIGGDDLTIGADETIEDEVMPDLIPDGHSTARSTNQELPMFQVSQGIYNDMRRLHGI